MGKLRRSSFKAAPKGKDRNGKTLSGTPVQIALCQALLNGPLPAHYLHASWRSRWSAIDCITFLSQEGIIRIPDDAIRSFGRPRIYELSPKGIKFLKDHGAYTGPVKHGNGQYKHSHMVAVCDFLFRKVPQGVAFHEHGNLFSNWPIKPDSTAFGFEGSKKYHLCGFEADRGMESLTGYAKETIENKVLAYTEFFANKGYRPELKNCAVAFITMSEQRTQNILDLISQKAGDEKDHFLVRALPDFIHWEKYPDPTDFLFTTDWQSPVGPVNILNILEGGDKRADRPKDLGAVERVD